MKSDLVELRSAEIRRVAEGYGVIRLRVFGSFALGEATETSDIDFLVEFEQGRSLLDLVGLKEELEALLGRRVDVVEEGGLSPYLRDRILQEAVPL
jgi:predicted nucleotidyltransferase